MAAWWHSSSPSIRPANRLRSTPRPYRGSACRRRTAPGVRVSVIQARRRLGRTVRATRQAQVATDLADARRSSSAAPPDRRQIRSERTCALAFAWWCCGAAAIGEFGMSSRPTTRRQPRRSTRRLYDQLRVPGRPTTNCADTATAPATDARVLGATGAAYDRDWRSIRPRGGQDAQLGGATARRVVCEAVAATTQQSEGGATRRSPDARSSYDVDGRDHAASPGGRQ